MVQNILNLFIQWEERCVRGSSSQDTLNKRQKETHDKDWVTIQKVVRQVASEVGFLFFCKLYNEPRAMTVLIQLSTAWGMEETCQSESYLAWTQTSDAESSTDSCISFSESQTIPIGHNLKQPCKR